MGFLFAFLSAFLFATSNIVIKKGMKSAQRDNGVFITLLMNVLCLGTAACLYRWWASDPAPAQGAGIFFFVLAGLLTSLIGRYSLFVGIRQIGPSRSVAIKNSAPLFTLIFAIFILQETLTLWPWIGMGLLFIGLFIQGIQMFRKEERQAAGSGYVFALCAALGFGFGQAVRKQALLDFYDPFAGAFIGAVVAFVSFCVLEACRRNLGHTLRTNWRFKNGYYVAGGVILSLAVLSFFISISLIHVAYTGAIVAIEPVLTLVFSRLFLQMEEKLSPLVIASASVVFLGAGVIALTG